MKFSREELEHYRGAAIPDVLSNGVKLLFVGVNPGLRSAAINASFANRGNRFFPALYRAGITDRIIDTSSGFRSADLEHLADRGVGMTTLVNYATAKGSELTAQQLRAGRQALEQTVHSYGPEVVAVLGVAAYRTAFSEPHAAVGLQALKMATAEVWVVPNPSGLNAHYSLAEISAAYGEVALAAGIRLFHAPEVG